MNLSFFFFWLVTCKNKISEIKYLLLTWLHIFFYCELWLYILLVIEKFQITDTFTQQIYIGKLAKNESSVMLIVLSSTGSATSVTFAVSRQWIIQFETWTLNDQAFEFVHTMPYMVHTTSFKNEYISFLQQKFIILHSGTSLLIQLISTILTMIFETRYINLKTNLC